MEQRYRLSCLFYCTYCFFVSFDQSVIVRSLLCIHSKRFYSTETNHHSFLLILYQDLIMLASSTCSLFLTLCITMSTFTSALGPANDPFVLQRQDQIQQPVLLPHTPTAFHTLTRTTTTISYTSKTYTAIRTRYVAADGTTSIPSAVRRWHSERDLRREKGHLEEDFKDMGCDLEACGSCRVWYGCGGMETTW